MLKLVLFHLMIYSKLFGRHIGIIGERHKGRRAMVDGGGEPEREGMKIGGCRREGGGEDYCGDILETIEQLQ